MRISDWSSDVCSSDLHRNVATGNETLLDLEAGWCCDVLKIDASKRRSDRDDGIDETIDVGCVNLDVKHIDPTEVPEKNALAFHHRFARESSQVAEDRKSTRLNSSH